MRNVIITNRQSRQLRGQSKFLRKLFYLISLEIFILLLNRANGDTHMNFAAGVILVVMALYRFEKERAKATPEKPCRWWYYLPSYLCLIIAIFLFTSVYDQICRWGFHTLMTEIVPPIFILFVLTVWGIICNFLKFGKIGYSILCAILLLLVSFSGYLIYTSFQNALSEDIANFRQGIANCNQALSSGKKEDLKKKIAEFDKTIGKIKSLPVLTREFEKITASVSNTNDGVQP